MRCLDFHKFCFFVSLVSATWTPKAKIVQDVLSKADAIDHGQVTFLPEWDVLGPFRIGTRGTSRLRLSGYPAADFTEQKLYGAQTLLNSMGAFSI